MPPKKEKVCSCEQHDTWSIGDSAVSNFITGKKMKKGVISYMLEHGYILSHHKFLCQNCYEYAAKLSCVEKLTFEEFCMKITNNDLSTEETMQLCKAFATFIKLNMPCDQPPLNTQEVVTRTSNYEDRYHVLFNFLKALCNSDKLNIIPYTLEHIVALTSNKYIGVHNFAKNILTYLMTGSRQLVFLNNVYSPCGSYTTVIDYLKNKLMDHIPELTSDCIIFFDNNQILARSWSVKYNSKPLISVITTCIALIPPEVTTLQDSINYSAPDKIEVTVANEDESDFRIMRNKYILHALSETPSETDDINKKRKVTLSDGKIVSQRSTINDPYRNVESFVSGKTKVKIMDPIMVNPCSYESVECVLNNLTQHSTKKWNIIGCDGLPYNLAAKLIDNIYICPHCNGKYNKQETFVYHLQQYNVNVEIKQCRKFGQVLLIPGFGHIDINVTKALFRLLWIPYLKRLAILLGWKSVRALACCENCSDHHKSTQILGIFFKSCSNALLSIYKDNTDELNLETYYDFAKQQSNNYQFLFTVTFTFLFAWKTLKEGMRRGNFNVIKNSMDKLSLLFYGLNMTTYMEIWLRFENTLITAPPEIREFITKNLCVSQSGHPSKAEGGDFVLENVNKKVKGYMPQGVPTEERWLRVCRNMEHIEQIKTSMMDVTHSTPVKGYFRTFSDEEAVEVFSEEIKRHLKSSADNISIDGNQLDEDLPNFESKCRTNKHKYYQNFPDVTRICERIFITPADRESYYDIRNKTKTEIQNIILQLIQDIDKCGGEDEASDLSNQWNKDVKCGTKKVYLSFYQEVVQVLEEVTSKGNETDLEEESDNTVV